MSVVTQQAEGREASRWHAILIILLTTAAVSLPLLWGRVLSGHDIVTYLINAQQTAANLREGAIFPTWGGGFNAGFGAPGLLFYPPLTSYVHAVPVLATVPVIVGVSGMTVLALFLSGFAAWWWLESVGCRRAALPAACVYLFAPYRFIDIYARSALSEHWAFVWPPLILLIASLRNVRATVRVPFLALAVAGLLLTNLPLAALFGIGLAGWFVVSGRVVGHRSSIIAGAALGFALAAFQLVPQALSHGLLDVDRFYGPNAGKFSASANTLFASGFDSWRGNVEYSTCVVVSFLLVVVAYLLLSKEERRQPSNRWILAAALACCVVATPPFGPVWDAVPVFSQMQFPWRLAAIMTLLVSAAVARLSLRRALVFLPLAIVAAVPFNNWHRLAAIEQFMPDEKPRVLTDNPVFPDPVTAWEAGSSGWYWRHHTLAEIWLIPIDTGDALFAELAGRFPPEYDHIRNRPAVLLEDPDASFHVTSWGQTKREIEVDTRRGGTVVWRALYFPRMRVLIDGSPTKTEIEPVTGLISHRVPEGTHVLTWLWLPLQSFKAARLVTVASSLAAVALLSFALVSRSRQKLATSHESN